MEEADVTMEEAAVTVEEVEEADADDEEPG